MKHCSSLNHFSLLLKRFLNPPLKSWNKLAQVLLSVPKLAAYACTSIYSSNALMAIWRYIKPPIENWHFFLADCPSFQPSGGAVHGPDYIFWVAVTCYKRDTNSFRFASIIWSPQTEKYVFHIICLLCWSSEWWFSPHSA